MPEVCDLLIGGHSISGGGRDVIPVVNPATEEVVALVTAASNQDIADALDASEKAFASWRTTTPYQRAGLLKRVAEMIRDDAEALARILTIDQGKTLKESRIEIAVTADSIEWVAEECKRTYGQIVPSREEGLKLLVDYEPIGPVAAFSPWNFPAFNPGRKIATAVAAGCSVISKPSEETPRCTLALARIFAAAGAPKGLVNVVLGDPPAIARQLLRSPVIRKVAFTGSVKVGKELTVMAAETLKHVTMELGGHAPVIVFDDVDIDAVAEATATGRFRNAGQVCVSPSRFFVHQSVYTRFVNSFAKKASSLVVGDGLDERTGMGPLASARRVDAMEKLVDDAVGKGARVLTGGTRVGNRGFFFAPTVLSEVPANAHVMTDEIFGPIAPIVPFDDEDEVISRANELPLGLASYVYTSSGARGQRVVSQIEAGSVALNNTVVALPELPFGGVKDSGLGREAGQDGIREHLIKKTITMRAR
jgi:succinate-semialdehyde dehydrogenase / glutarate-semialdehyde dehydrogenase